MNTIKGSINVITGCGSGLGLATLKRFLEQGSGPILGIDRKFTKDYESNLNLQADQRDKLVLKQHNTFDHDVESSIEEFSKNFGTIDNLINVAGVAMAFTLTQKSGEIYKLANAQDLIQFNTLGTFNVISAASRYMVNPHATDNGRTKCIINTSCISTTKPSVGQSFYAGSKAALDSMTLSIARDLSGYNIRCNTINVGYFDTPLLRNGSSGAICDYLATNMVLCPRRLGTPEEFAHLVQSMIENQMLNGCCIKLDGLCEPAQDRPVGKWAGT